VVGESGSGKSTLARTVVGLNTPGRGTIRVDGAQLERTRGAAARTGLQMVFQDHASTLNPFQSIGRSLDEVIRQARPNLSLAERSAAAVRLLERIGLGADALERRPSGFSGGQRQRISIARALGAEPRLLICDEPTSALDVSVQAQILALLEELRGDGLSLLFISHNLAVVRQVSDRIAVMYAGRIVETGPAADLIREPAHPYTAALVAAAPVLADRGSLLSRTRALRGGDGGPAPSDGCAFAGRCPHVQSSCAVMPPLAEVAPGRLVRCHLPFVAPPAAETPALR
jgi:oligopeptide/dipeptide ABC transporter ATP-binding protein